MALPSNVSTGMVRGLFLRGIIDGPDVDQEPEGIPIPGLTITFTPNLDPAIVTDATSTPPATILVAPVVAMTDDTGTMISQDNPNATGIRLIASGNAALNPNGWTWGARISGPDFPTLGFNFVMPPNGDIDLSTVVPVPPSPGEDLLEWQEAVSATLANVILAQNAATQAEAAVSAFVFVVDDLLPGGLILAEMGAISLDPDDDMVVDINSSGTAFRVPRLDANGRLEEDVFPVGIGVGIIGGVNKDLDGNYFADPNGPLIVTMDEDGNWFVVDPEFNYLSIPSTRLHTSVNAPAVDVQTFTANGTWTKPTGAKSAHVYMVGGGGGGGSGRKGALTTIRTGGGGGGGTGITEFHMDAALLTATVAVTVGLGGAGGAVPAAVDTNGNAGVSGSGSQFGNYARTGAGGGGAGGGLGTAASGGAGGAGVLAGGAGAASQASGLIGAASASVAGASGGGSGAGLTAADASAAGGAGSTSLTTLYSGGAGGAPGAAGGAGTASPTSAGRPGSGGGGGGSAVSSTSGAGGAGGIYGGGGGGGGASTNGQAASVGGAGGNGIVIVTTYF